MKERDLKMRHMEIHPRCVVVRGAHDLRRKLLGRRVAVRVDSYGRETSTIE